ncbi:MAG: hypothetical protein ACQERN_13480 [Thermodesulfobacteriota bacterium]
MVPKSKFVLFLFGFVVLSFFLAGISFGVDADNGQKTGPGNENSLQKANQPDSGDKSAGQTAGPSSRADLLQRASALIEGAEAVYDEEQIDNFKQAVGLFEQFLDRHPDHFEANWKCAKACRLYGEEARKRKAEGWKKICAEYGKKGMEYGEKAMDLEPDKPHGYYFYALCVGTYSDGVGLFTALREGLKDKTQNNLEKVYNMDKFFEHGGPVIALGRFWQVVPWPYSDADKAMEYYRELEQSKYFKDGRNVEIRIYMAEILMDRWGGESEEEARKLLQPVPEMTEDPYWRKRAQDLLNEL